MGAKCSESSGIPLSEGLATLQRLMGKDLEQDHGGNMIRQGVAEDRHVSFKDPEMRHGRKSKRFNGFERHIATSLGSGLILSGAITPANRPEDEASAGLANDTEKQRRVIGELCIDRGYVKADLVGDVLSLGGEIVCSQSIDVQTRGGDGRRDGK